MAQHRKSRPGSRVRSPEGSRPVAQSCPASSAADPVTSAPLGRAWSVASGHGSWGGSAGPAKSPGDAAGRGAGPLGRGLVVGSAGAERLRVPLAAGGQHAAGATHPGARPRPGAEARPPPRRRLRPPASRPAEAKAKPRTSPAPAPQQGPDPGWGDRIPLEILLRIFGLLVEANGPMPFLGRAARVCRRWHEAASQPALWHTLTLSPPLAGRPAKGGAKAEKKLLASLEWLIPNRWPCLPQLVSESCPRLTFLKLSDCHSVTPNTLIMLAKACPQLHSLDVQHSMVESTAVVSFLEEAGPRMRKLWLTYSSQTTAILGALLGSCCPQLQVLEVSTGINHNITPLQLPVEALQKGCPQLQVLRLLNLMWLPKPSGRAVTPGPGFPSLEELCLASSTCNFVSNEVLDRLLHGSPNLRLLDLRGCARITPAGLHDLPCQELEQLHLGLYGMSDRLTLAKEGSPLLTQKWCHTLQELDLSGQGFSEKDLEQALAAFSGTPEGSHPALCSLNLRGTQVTPSTVSSVISSCPGLLYLNLESCRCLPRGLKRAYRGPGEVQWCLEQLLTSLPSVS
ncbi:F-box/LRR-repeat protein 6 [Camelus dromedarius]|uniref:F-box/LRR-repeat protein 6 n=1 Tax=Camelus dromedarius TaxID=9838 RepID=A0A5N4CGM7_CAMDR|nr:F-box/LRR-repeat protein 6 [Camelus dromedarius]